MLSLAAVLKVAAKESITGLRLTARSLGWIEPPRIILGLGHMRSGSTLLHHLLASHPQLRGRGERNRPYRTRADLERLVVDVCVGAERGTRKLHGPFRSHRGRSFLDQVNHDRFTPSTALLEADEVRKIFLIRRPLTAIASMVDVLGHHHDFGLEQAVSYYCERLQDLVRLAQNGPRERQFFLHYEDLVGGASLESRPPVLGELTRFLGLESPLEPSYRRFDFTGGRGDPSAAILQGRIVPNSRPDADLEPELRHRVEEVFTESSHSLAESCQTGHQKDR